jgi:hypothetical protein
VASGHGSGPASPDPVVAQQGGALVCGSALGGSAAVAGVVCGGDGDAGGLRQLWLALDGGGGRDGCGWRLMAQAAAAAGAGQRQ